LIITHVSHLDHGLTGNMIAWILKEYKARQAFFADTVQFPSDMGYLRCGLYGPIMGDPEIGSSGQFTPQELNLPSGDGKRLSYFTRMAKRGDRKGESRLVNLPPRPTNKLTVIAGPYEEYLNSLGEPCDKEADFALQVDYPCVLYTCYGGPLAPREPWDMPRSGPDWEKNLAASEAFWAVHALSDQAEG